MSNTALGNGTHTTTATRSPELAAGQLAELVASPASRTEVVQGAQDPMRRFVEEIPASIRDRKTIVSEPIAGPNSTTHGSKTLQDFAELKRRELEGTLRDDEAEYVRYGTPITRQTERELAQLFGAEGALVFCSGMAAIEKTLESVLDGGGHIIVFAQGYRQTNALLERWAKRGGLELSMIPIEGFNQLNEHLRPDTKAVFFETPSNPFLRVLDVRGVKEQLRNAGSEALLIVDDTFAPPPNQNSIALGADLVVPSLTKYLSGSNQVLGGAVMGRQELLRPISELRSQCGNISRDNDCQGVLDGLTTLHERIERSNENGMHVAELLARNPHVSTLYYPGHSSHPDYHIAQAQMSGFGGVVSFRIKAHDLHAVAAFTNAFVRASPEGTFIAPSFGGELPLISAVAVVSHFRQSAEERASRGIPIDLIRLSVGTIPKQQLTDALAAGFEALESYQKGQ
jgi:cystathionine gamma-synthase